MENCDVQEKAQKKVSSAQRQKIYFFWRSNSALCTRQEPSPSRRKRSKYHDLGAAPRTDFQTRASTHAGERGSSGAETGCHKCPLNQGTDESNEEEPATCGVTRKPVNVSQTWKLRPSLKESGNYHSKWQLVEPIIPEVPEQEETHLLSVSLYLCFPSIPSGSVDAC